MKEKIFILPFLLYPMMGSGLTFYYDTTGNCSTFCKTPYAGVGCCPQDDTLTSDELYDKLSDLAMARDEVFQGLKIGDTVIMDPAGGLILDGKGINALSLPATTTIRTSETNTCQSGSSRTSVNNLCVSNSSDVSYVSFDIGDIENGYEIDKENLTRGETEGKGCQAYSKFKIQIHWCPETYQTFTWRWANTGNEPQGWTAAEAPTLWPESGCVDGPLLDYEWKNRSSLTTGNATYKINGSLITELTVPSQFASGWKLRGFYLLNYPTQPSNCEPGDHNTTSVSNDCIRYWGYRNTAAQNLVAHESNSWGVARLGLKVGSSADWNVIPLDDTDLNNWGNTRWTIYSCTEIPEDTVFHMYAGWARDCSIEIPDGSGEPSPSCNLTIKRNGLTQSSNKGDAFYATTCSNGDTPVNNNAYNPTCIGQKVCELQEGMHWCFVGSFPQCVSTDTAYNCCTDNVTGCTKQGACEDMGGTWNGTSCTSGRDMVGNLEEAFTVPDNIGDASDNN